MNDIMIFNNPEFGEVRTVMIDGEPWFCGKDVARNLGYANEKNAIKRHCEEGEVTKQALGVQTGIKKDGTPAMMEVEAFFVNESGLYSLIFGSKLESAKKFKRWVTSEVLPQLRKTGSYGLRLTTEEQIRLIAQGNVELNRKVAEVEEKTESLEERFDKFEKELPLLPEEAESVSGAVKKRVVEILGGKKSNAYHDKSISQTAFMDAYRNLKRNFNVRSYKCIKRHQIDLALRIAMEYEPPMFLENLIKQSNAQITLDC